MSNATGGLKYWCVTYEATSGTGGSGYFYAETRADALPEEVIAAAVGHIHAIRGGGKNVTVDEVDPPTAGGSYAATVTLPIGRLHGL